MGSLRFHLFRFPVEIQPGFWLLALIIGFRGDRPVREALSWLGIVFVSILVHELGHAFAARGYGQEPRIALHMLGGLTSWSPTHELGRRRRILITLAGPGAGFALGFAAAGALIAWRLGVRQPMPSEAHGVLERLAWVNVFWSTVNLVPVMPFDGGQVLATALGPERRKLSAGVSLAFGLLTALVLYRLGLAIGAVLFAMGGVSSFISAMQGPARPRLPPQALAELVREAWRALERGEPSSATAMAAAVLDSSQDPSERCAAQEILTWAALQAGDVAAARDALRSAGPGADPYLRAAVAEADGDPGHALELLENARQRGDTRVELTAALVRLLLTAGRAVEAAELALGIADQVPDADLRKIADLVERAGAGDSASKLRDKLTARASET
jgi:Zn-dependent protease